MNYLLTLFALCCVSTIHTASIIEKRFTQNFFGPVYKQSDLTDKFVVNAKLPQGSVFFTGKKSTRDQELFANQRMSTEKFSILRSEESVLKPRAYDRPRYKDMKFKRDLKNTLEKRAYNRPQYKDIRFKRDLVKLEKRGFNQQFNGPIMNQQNVENYQKQDFWGPLTAQFNIDNSQKNLRPPQAYQPNVRPNSLPNNLPEHLPNVRPGPGPVLPRNGRPEHKHRPIDQQHRYKRVSEVRINKRGFMQQFNGPIGNQQNIERYQKQDYWGPIHSQLNVDNSGNYKRSSEIKLEKRHFNQAFNGPILNQQNIENYQKQDYYGSINEQTNVDNSGIYKRGSEVKLEKRYFNQAYNGPIANQQNIENYQKQDYYGSIGTQLNIDNSKSNVGTQQPIQPVGGPVGGPVNGNRPIGGNRPVGGPIGGPVGGQVGGQVGGPVGGPVNGNRPIGGNRPVGGPIGGSSGGLLVNQNVKPEEKVTIVNVVNNNNYVKDGTDRVNGNNRGDGFRGEGNRGGNFRGDGNRGGNFRGRHRNRLNRFRGGYY